MLNPSFETLPAFTVAGMETFDNPADRAFGKMWTMLMGSPHRIPHCTNNQIAYGIEVYTEEMKNERKWFYLAGYEVDDLVNLPVVFSVKVIPENTYAVFEYKGAITEELFNTFQKIYQEWLPDSGFELAGSYDFERYDERFLGPDNENSVLSIYIPVCKINP